jgi:hypothetical protein
VRRSTSSPSSATLTRIVVELERGNDRLDDLRLLVRDEDERRRQVALRQPGDHERPPRSSRTARSTAPARTACAACG